MTAGPCLLIVSPNRLLADALARRLSCCSAAGVEAVPGAPFPGRESRPHPDIALVDATDHLPWSQRVVRHYRRRYPNCRIIVLVAPGDDERALSLVESGSTGALSIADGLEALVKAVCAVQEGGIPCPPRMAAMLFRRLHELSSSPSPRARGPVLSSRQRDVFRLVARGLSDKEIAQRLNISSCTVKNHVHNTMARLQVHCRRDALIAAHRFGLLDVGDRTMGGSAARSRSA